MIKVIYFDKLSFNGSFYTADEEYRPAAGSDIEVVYPDFSRKPFAFEGEEDGFLVWRSVSKEIRFSSPTPTDGEGHEKRSLDPKWIKGQLDAGVAVYYAVLATGQPPHVVTLELDPLGAYKATIEWNGKPYSELITPGELNDMMELESSRAAVNKAEIFCTTNQDKLVEVVTAKNLGIL